MGSAKAADVTFRLPLAAAERKKRIPVRTAITMTTELHRMEISPRIHAILSIRNSPLIIKATDSASAGQRVYQSPVRNYHPGFSRLCKVKGNAGGYGRQVTHQRLQRRLL